LDTATPHLARHGFKRPAVLVGSHQTHWVQQHCGCQRMDETRMLWAFLSGVVSFVSVCWHHPGLSEQLADAVNTSNDVTAAIHEALRPGHRPDVTIVETSMDACLSQGCALFRGCHCRCCRPPSSKRDKHDTRLVSSGLIRVPVSSIDCCDCQRRCFHGPVGHMQAPALSSIEVHQRRSSLSQENMHL
jgi:hypothetical protein